MNYINGQKGQCSLQREYCDHQCGRHWNAFFYLWVCSHIKKSDYLISHQIRTNTLHRKTHRIVFFLLKEPNVQDCKLISSIKTLMHTVA